MVIKYKKKEGESDSCINYFIPHIPIKHHDDHNISTTKYCSFNVTTPRFENLKHDLPGPGYYIKDKEDNYVVFSKKGFGVGFTSKEKRFKDENLNDIGPGKYSILKMERYYEQQKILPMKNFKSKIALPTPFEPTPGPSDYNLIKSEQALLRTNLEKKMNYTFKSNIPRFAESKYKCSLPAPGYYNVKKEDSKPSAISSFKSNGRKKDYITINDGPGPGSYFKELQSTNINKSGPRSKLILGLVANTPDPSEFIHPNYPGPGYYDIQNGSKISEIINGYKKGQSFSNSKRFSKSDDNIPGPGHYQPVDNVHHSYHINHYNQWL
ncbi:hypothetical protein H8356DRAFT_1676153 [Neocallimastix lanati (nom. inval.)]|nr:hypothetical protein H8356DRAFT_1676153 [Neocallimastix sp. JGI-2020a]